MNIPQKYQKLFWDVSPESLQWRENKHFILARFLNFGTMEALQWLENNYGFLAEMPVFLNSTHARKLDKKTLNFWKQYFDMKDLPWETATYKRLRQKFWVD